MNAKGLDHSALRLNGLIRFHVSVSVKIDQRDARIQIKYLMKNCANVSAQRYSDALVDRNLIHKLVSVNVQNLHRHVLMIRNSTMWHANASALIDQIAALTLRYLTMINVDVDAPVYSDVPVDRDLIQVRVSVNAQNRDLHVLMIRNSTMWHANVSVRIDQQDAFTHKFLITIPVNVVAQLYSDVPADRGSIQIHVSVNAQSLYLHALMIRNLMMWHANVFALIDQIAALTHKFLTMIPVGVAALGLFNVLVDRDSIQIHVSVNVQNLHLHALMIRNSMMWHANASVRIDQ